MLALLAAPAHAQELRELCSDRPGLETPPCTVDPGHVQVETGLGDWTLDRDGGSRTDTILAADTLVRFGLTDSLEARLGWTPYGHARMREADGSVSRRSGVGDLTLGFKQNLRNPDGSGLSLALVPYATLPVGREPIGAGTWGAGLIGSLGYELNDHLQVVASPEIDAAPDEDGAGRHLAWGGEIGLSADVGGDVTATADVEFLRDRDPAGHMTESLAGLSLAWQPVAQLQLDVGSNVGLNHASPDVELYFGISRKF